MLLTETILVSLSTKEEIWSTLAREKYPTLTEDQIQGLGLKAASEWYIGGESDLADLYNQYVMLKNLKGL